MERITSLNLEVIRADEARNLLLVKGAIPGARSSVVFVRRSVRQAQKATS